MKNDILISRKRVMTGLLRLIWLWPRERIELTRVRYREKAYDKLCHSDKMYRSNPTNHGDVHNVDEMRIIIRALIYGSRALEE